MRTRRTLAAAVAVASAGVALITPAAADAAWTREASFTDAAGQSNGCVASLDRLTIAGPTVDGGGTPGGLHSVLVVTCPPAANVHRLTVSVALDRILPDGTVEVIYPLNRDFRQSYPLPFESTRALYWFACTTPTFAGTHQWRLRVLVKSKQTPDNSDPFPFVARTQVKRTLTCAS